MEITDSPEFASGWAQATWAVIDIWNHIKETYNTPEEQVAQFELFMVMCELRLNGADWNELATVAELNDRPELAAEARKLN